MKTKPEKENLKTLVERLVEEENQRIDPPLLCHPMPYDIVRAYAARKYAQILHRPIFLSNHIAMKTGVFSIETTGIFYMACLAHAGYAHAQGLPYHGMESQEVPEALLLPLFLGYGKQFFRELSARNRLVEEVKNATTNDWMDDPDEVKSSKRYYNQLVNDASVVTAKLFKKGLLKRAPLQGLLWSGARAAAYGAGYVVGMYHK
ncbi:hypothetical protein HZB02_05285 [Candidatus Woesearchaeota archaeon]|nr:hypothetical protein [Candidatus Woesearchaeota archaeon]